MDVLRARREVVVQLGARNCGIDGGGWWRRIRDDEESDIVKEDMLLLWQVRWSASDVVEEERGSLG